MAVFTRFGSDVDEATAKLLRRGECLTELLKQGKGEPMSLFEQTVTLLAYRENVFDNIPVKGVREKARDLIEKVRAAHPEYEFEINNTGKLTDDIEEQLKRFLGEH